MELATYSIVGCILLHAFQKSGPLSADRRQQNRGMLDKLEAV